MYVFYTSPMRNQIILDIVENVPLCCHIDEQTGIPITHTECQFLPVYISFLTILLPHFQQNGCKPFMF